MAGAGRRGTLWVAFALLAMTGCRDAPQLIDCGTLAPNARARDASVVVVVADAMRRDVSRLYGGSARTPVLERFAASGIVFERAYSQAPWTKASIASLFTGLYPSQHRLATHTPARRPDAAARTSDVLSPSLATLAEAYRQAGFATAAFVSNPWLDAEFGFAQGFQVYDDSFARWEAPGSLVSLAAARWLEERPRDEKFFLYLHYLEPHRPYGPLDRAETLAAAAQLARDDRPLSDEARRVLADNARFSGGGSALDEGIPPSLALLELAYAKGVERFDQALGEFVEAFARARDPADAAWVLTSDHGESLYAHGIGNHGTSLYEDEVAIPLVMRLPGVSHRGVRNVCPVGLVDLMPFLCAYSALACGADLAGRDHLSAAGDDPPRYVVTEGVRGSARHRALVGDRYKLVYAPDRPELRERRYRFFDLERDPGEERDWVLERPARLDEHPEFARMRHALPEAVDPFDAPTAEHRPLRPELEERLEALGYFE